MWNITTLDKIPMGDPFAGTGWEVLFGEKKGQAT
jgi:hypothetical protein